MKLFDFTRASASRTLAGMLGAAAIFAMTTLVAPTVWATNCAPDTHCPECATDADCPDRAFCNPSTSHCVYPNLPCTTDADCVNGQLCNPGSGRCEYPTDECRWNSDCDDGLFCNGAEYCNRFRGCKSGSPACGDGVACTVDSCDESTKSCTNVASHASCDDGLYCNGEETCDAVQGCVSAAPVDCGESGDFCGASVCDEDARGCIVVPQNDGLDCQPRDADTCVLSAVCSTGACLVTPLCSPTCQRCDVDAGCASLCGNPYANGDDLVNTTDALFTLRASVELETCDLCICDVNGDGQVTATDTLMMLRQIVGLGDLFICPTDEAPPTTSTTTSTTSTLPQL